VGGLTTPGAKALTATAMQALNPTPALTVKPVWKSKAAMLVKKSLTRLLSKTSKTVMQVG
jgi:hypothetical protein